MRLFPKNGTSKVPDDPPIFFKHSTTDQPVLKRPARCRLDLNNSSPSLGSSLRQQEPTKSSLPTQRRSSFSGAVSPKNTQGSRKPKSAPTKKTNISPSGDESYIEELVDDDSYYEEEIIEEYYYEEEIIEIVEETKLPEREITIKFDNDDEIQTTLHINNYSSGEVEKSWYCRADYDKMVEKARSTAAKAEAKDTKQFRSDTGQSSSSDKGTRKKELETRGLEGWSTEGSKKVRELKEKALEAVWNEQNRQWTTGAFDIEKVRVAYRTVSALAQAMAEARALEDRAFVEKNNKKDLNRKKDVRRIMITGKSALGKSMKGGFVMAKKQVAKVAHKSKKVDDTEQRQIFRQPSQGSRLLLADNLDDSQSIELTENELHGVSISRSDRSNKKSPRKGKLTRTASWESGLASGKY